MTQMLEERLSDMEKAGLIDRESSVFPGGGIVWLPNGMKWRKLIYEKYFRILEGAGFEPLQLPRIVSGETLDIVADKFMDFRKGVYWPRSRTEEPNRDPRYLNSTSDPVINHWISKTLRKNPLLLPLKVYLKEQIFRPKKGGIPFVCQEEHDVVEAYDIRWTEQEREQSFEESVELLKGFFEELDIGFISIDQSTWGNKPVAKRVCSLQTFIPSLRSMTRLGTAYMHDETFSRIFGIYRKVNNKKQFARQICLGFGERFLLALIDHHHDNWGVAFPPDVAPVQIAVIPINPDSEETAREFQKRVPYRCTIDKEYSWDFQKRLKRYLVEGVPLRVRISDPESIEYSRRDTLERKKCGMIQLVNEIPAIFLDMGLQYARRSQKILGDRIFTASSIEDFSQIIHGGNVARVYHCGAEPCGRNLEDQFAGELLGKLFDEREGGSCILCNRPAYASLYGRRAQNP